MSSVGPLELLTVSDGSDSPTRQHRSKNRNSSCCRCLTKIYSFRVPVWQMLLFQFIAAVLIAVLGILMAMFGPGNTELKYRTKLGTGDAPGNKGKRSLHIK